MTIPNPPLTDDKTLNLVLLLLVQEINKLQQKQNTLRSDITEATDFAALQTKVNNRR